MNIRIDKLSLPHGEALNKALNVLLATLELENGAAASRNYEVYQRFTDAISHFEPVRSHLSTFDVAEIVSERVARHLSRQQIHASGRLAEVVTADSVRAIREDLRQYLQFLPAPYEAWFPLPAIAQWGPGGIQLTRDLTLIETAPGAPGVAEDASAGLPGLAPERSYLRVKCSGYGTASADCTAMADALSKLKQFFFLAARAELVTHVYGICAVIGMHSTHCQLREDSPDMRSDALMPVALPDAIRRYLLTASIAEPNREALFPALAVTRRLMDRAGEDEDALRIRTAIEWAFDSMQNENQTLAVVQACTGLESLLGDEDEDEPALSTLADRCAYLLGQGASQREHVRKRFRDVYRLRSNLIGGRAARLANDEREVLGLAHGLLCNAIRVAIAKRE